ILREADLIGADLSEAHLKWTVFGDVDLSQTKGLETVRHAGPSTIDIDTIYRSRGNIPHTFLRGCGVPDNFIEYMASLTGKAFEFYSCFISHSSKDHDFAQRLHDNLQGKGVRCWFAPEDIQGGRKLHEQLEQAIRLHEKLLLVLSEHSMNSEWVKTEIYHARQQEIESGQRKLFPISLVPYETVRQWRAFDADVGKDMAREVREYFIPDFSNWKDHDGYQKAFDRLLRDLKQEDGEASP
ncbi:MAG: TIR domain-containing protein, partial [Anaerolineae bacterium]